MHIVTATAREIDLENPIHEGQIDLRSISHHLAQIVRFTGAARRPYSVAEHSLLVLEIYTRTGPHQATVDGMLAALLHDAHEAYCGDLATPHKLVLGAAWRAYETTWADVVRRAFGVHHASQTYAAQIHRADMIALATERRDLLHPDARTPWPGLHGVEPADWVDLMDPGRVKTTWLDWESRFRDAVDALDFARLSSAPATAA